MIRIAALGDSLTKGVVLTENKRYSILDNNFMNILSKELGLFVENFGRLGCTIGFGHTVVDRHADVISSSDYTFIEYGGNDCDFEWMKIADSPTERHHPKTALKLFKQQIAALIDRVRMLGSKPILVSLPPIISDVYFSYFSHIMSEEQKRNVFDWLGGDISLISRWHESYNRALFDVARSSSVDIIDITTPFDTYRGPLNALYCSDGIHPNESGHKLIAESIINSYL